MKHASLLSLLFFAPAAAQNCELPAPVVPSPLASEQAGSDIEVSGDRMVVGAPATDAGSNGRALVYRREAGGWVLEAQLDSPPSSSVAAHRFGTAVAIDGGRIAVSAPGHYVHALASGRVFLYELDESGPTPVWNQTAAIVNPAAQWGGSLFGHSVDMHEGFLSIGAPKEVRLGKETGAVHVFDLSSGTPQPVITHEGLETGDLFGWDVAQFSDFTLVGAPGGDDEGIDNGYARLCDADGPVRTFGGSWADDGMAIGTSVDFDLAESTGAYNMFFAIGAANGMVVAYERDYVPPSFPFGTGAVTYDLQAWYRGDFDGADGFGSQVELHDGHLWIGAPSSDVLAPDGGAVYAYYMHEDYDPDEDTVKVLGAHFGQVSGAGFGSVLASDLVGSSIVVASPLEDTAAPEAGTVRLYPSPIHDCPSYADAPLLSTGVDASQPGDGLGTSMGRTGRYYLFGRPGAQDEGPMSGGLMAMLRSSKGWAVSAPVEIPGHVAGDELGASVAAVDGVALVGAPGAELLGTRTGAIHVLEHGEMHWKDAGYLAPWGLGPDARFGETVEMDDEWAFGSFRQGGLYGGVRTFERIVGGAWQQRADLFSPNIAADDRFGAAIDVIVYEDEDEPEDSVELLLVGAPGYSSERGQVIVHELDSPTWKVRNVVSAPGLSAGDELGASVDLYVGSDTRVAVGAPGTNGNTGRVHVYLEQPGEFGPELAHRWTVDPPAGSAGARFGEFVLVSGTLLYVGAPAGPGSGQGKVYRYRLEYDGTSDLIDTYTLPSGHDGDRFGETWEVVSGDLLIGAPGAYGKGSTYLEVWGSQPTLEADRHYLSLASGGEQVFDLRAGWQQGGKLYWMLGSLSGTGPTPFFGVDLPLTVDPYFDLTLNAPSAGVLDVPIGVLQGDYGEGQVRAVLPPGLPGSLAGATLYHAYFVLEPQGPTQVSWLEHCHLVP